jgi:aspartate/methionine/tyrosine aminotransferase
MFSSRLHWNLEPNRIAEAVARLRQSGAAILDLTESNPTHAELPYPEAEIGAALAAASRLTYDPAPAGLLSARSAVAAYYDGTVSTDRILLTTSTSEAYAYLFKLLTDPGDEILIPRPSYPLFDFLAGMELVRSVAYPLVYDGGWEIDFDSLSDQVTSRSRAIVVVNPNNPTGSFLKRREAERLIEFCRARELAIVCDEVFSDYGLTQDSERVSSLAQQNDVLTFCLSGLSKIAAMPQMKLGWIVACGAEAERCAALERLELIADTYLSVGTPVQGAAGALLAIGARLREAIRDRTRKNLASLRERVGSDSAFGLLRVEGGWYAVLQAPRIRTEEEWVLGLLEERGVLVQPGFFYDFAQEAFLIISLLTPPRMFEEGIQRMLSS